ncbi:PhzF family phenazine biosynthesis protein [Sagittula stellata]|uniref:PhzF family phenazine biosynthesis protein n=1 Tax=Sagittula stellata TaxID=52603 RepID=UPI0002FE505B|nr:PhzF family phenazine biosynthesis protein [Sagittula stellata]
MPDTLTFSTCDVFTTERFAGNPLAIVEGAGGLSTAQMQTITREFNLSETIFVMAPEDPAHTAKVRIFFPTAEIPFAGHPTVGCALHLALKDAPAGPFQTRIMLEEVAGLVPVDVWRDESTAWAEFQAPVLPFAPDAGTVPDNALLGEALGLAPQQIGFGAHRPGIWQGGPTFLYVPVSDMDALASARPLEPAWSTVMDLAGVDSAYVYTPGTVCDFRARVFSPAAGIPEDPATGSASALLAAQLAASGAIEADTARFILHQGVEMGRPSEIVLTVHTENGAPSRILVRGSAVPVSSGRIVPPDA